MFTTRRTHTMPDAVVSYTFFCASCKVENRTIWNRERDLTYEQAKRRILAEQWEYDGHKGFQCSWCALMEQYQKRLAELASSEEDAWMFEPLPLGRAARKERPVTQVVETGSPSILGRQLQQARKARGLTQEEAARSIDVARTTLVAMEKGERRVKPGELVKLAHIYGRQVSDFK